MAAIFFFFDVGRTRRTWATGRETNFGRPANHSLLETHFEISVYQMLLANKMGFMFLTFVVVVFGKLLIKMYCGSPRNYLRAIMFHTTLISFCILFFYLNKCLNIGFKLIFFP